MPDRRPPRHVLDDTLQRVFGSGDDPMPEVERRARERFPGASIIVWEGDAETFAFTYVGGDAEALLGHAPAAWTGSGTFWVDHVVHPDDRRDAVAYCALATGKRSDHVFEYRARHRDGRLVWLLDYVNVVLGERGVPCKLRGVMIDITDDKRADGAADARPALQQPSLDELSGMPD